MPPTTDSPITAGPARAACTPRTEFWYLPVWSLWKREVVRFLRQRSRIIGALGTPIVFWILLGSGLRNSFQSASPPGATDAANYLEYSYPGMMALIVLFTAIFSMISVIEDRRAGFMQAVLAAPVARSAIVVGKIMGSVTLAVGQALLFLLLAPAAGLSLSIPAIAATFFTLVILAIALSALGFIIAWPLDSTQGFHAIMNLFLIPMWLLSGAVFPPSGASTWMSWIMHVNPLTYGVTALRHALYWGGSPRRGEPSMALCMAVTVAFAIVVIALAARLVEKKG